MRAPSNGFPVVAEVTTRLSSFPGLISIRSGSKRPQGDALIFPSLHLLAGRDEFVLGRKDPEWARRKSFKTESAVLVGFDLATSLAAKQHLRHRRPAGHPLGRVAPRATPAPALSRPPGLSFAACRLPARRKLNKSRGGAHRDRAANEEQKMAPATTKNRPECDVSIPWLASPWRERNLDAVFLARPSASLNRFRPLHASSRATDSRPNRLDGVPSGRCQQCSFERPCLSDGSHRVGRKARLAARAVRARFAEHVQRQFEKSTANRKPFRSGTRRRRFRRELATQITSVRLQQFDPVGDPQSGTDFLVGLQVV